MLFPTSARHASRRLLALLFLLATVLLGSVLVLPVLGTHPISIETTDGGASIFLAVTDTSVFWGTECIEANWRLDDIRSVEFEDRGVVGEGHGLVCDGEANLNVVLRDGAEKEYRLPLSVRSESLLLRILTILAIGLGIAGVVLTGLHADVWSSVRNYSIVRAAGRRLPQVRHRDPDRSQLAIVLLTMVVVILVGAAVRAHFLSKPMRFDESWTYLDFASRPLADALTDYWSTNNHIFHTLLVHIATEIFGPYAWAIRLPVYFGSLLLIAASYRVGHELYDFRTGLIAAALVAGSSYMVEFSTNARGYVLMTLFFLLLILLASRLRQGSRRLLWAMFGLFTVLGLYTLPTMVYPLGIVAGWFMLSSLTEYHSRGRRAMLLRFVAVLIAAAAVTAALYLPAYLRLAGRSTSSLDMTHLGTISWSDVTASIRTSFRDLLLHWQQDVPAWLVPVLLLSFALGLVLHARTARHTVPLALVVVLWLPAVIFAQAVTTFERLWVFLFPLVALTAAAGLQYALSVLATARNRYALLLVALISVVVSAFLARQTVLGNSVYYAGGVDRAVDAEEVVLALKPLLKPADAVVCAGTCNPHRYYALLHGVRLQTVDRIESLPAGDLYLIVALPTFDTRELEPVLDYLQLDASQYETPRTLWDMTDSTVYLLAHVQ